MANLEVESLCTNVTLEKTIDNDVNKVLKNARKLIISSKTMYMMYHLLQQKNRSLILNTIFMIK